MSDMADQKETKDMAGTEEMKKAKKPAAKKAAGEKAPESDVQPGQEPTERVCPVCKSVVSAQLIYCPKCGEKLK